MKIQSPFSFIHPNPNTIFPDYFTLEVACRKDKAQITMRFLTEDVTTRRMNHVTRLLKMYLPTILQSSCFNEQNLPFYQEVTRTELGHLFEHILLEYLCKEKINAGNNEAIFSGVTKWNWNKETVGTFHIQVDVSRDDRELLYFALEESILLLKRIIHYHSFMLPYATLINFPRIPSSTIEKQMV